jgi:hypothetical protein
MPDASGRDAPSELAAQMERFRAAFTAPTWRHVLVLGTGALVSTVTYGLAGGCHAACSACLSIPSSPTTSRS